LFPGGSRTIELKSIRLKKQRIDKLKPIAIEEVSKPDIRQSLPQYLIEFAISKSFICE